MLDAPLGTHYTANILTIIGLIIVVAFLGNKAFQHLGIPQVVGFIVIGVALGPSLLNKDPLPLACCKYIAIIV